MLNIVICDDDIDFREIVEYKVRACLAGFFDTDYNIQKAVSLSRLAEILPALWSVSKRLSGR